MPTDLKLIDYNLRYLRPPTPPSPGPIIIQEINDNAFMTPPPPLIIRQYPKSNTNVTPPPIIIREKPPTPLSHIPRKVITVAGKNMPPPPRCVIII